LHLRAELAVSDALYEVLSSFASSLLCNDFLLGIPFTFFRGKDLLGSEILEDVVPNLQKDWAQFTLDVLSEILSEVDKGVKNRLFCKMK
jgi:TRAP-type mannitol/chloroaromatic compound transport system permease large subunit